MVFFLDPGQMSTETIDINKTWEKKILDSSK